MAEMEFLEVKNKMVVYDKLGRGLGLNNLKVT